MAESVNGSKETDGENIFLYNTRGRRQQADSARGLINVLTLADPVGMQCSVLAHVRADKFCHDVSTTRVEYGFRRMFTSSATRRKGCLP